MHRIRALWIALGPLAVGAWLMALLGLTWAARWSYPFDLEWMEGGMLAHAWRLDRGLPLYVAPNPDFVPFVYPPGYPVLVALAGKPWGLSLPVGRAVSLLGLLGATSALATGLWRHTGRARPALWGALVWLGAYPASGAFYDLVRPDAVALGLAAWALVIAAERRPGAPEAAGLLLCAAFACKQNTAAFGLPIALGLYARDGVRVALRFALVAALPALALTGWLQWLSEGHYLRYLVEVPASHPQYTQRILPGLPRELGNALPISTASLGAWFALRPARGRLPQGVITGLPMVAGIGLATGVHLAGPLPAGLLHVPAALGGFGLGASAVGLALAWVDGAWRSWRSLGLALLGITAVSMGALMRSHHGGYLNVYMPVHWVVAAGFGLVLARLEASGWRGLAALLITAELGFLGLRIDRDRLVPTARDRQRGEAFVAALRERRGPVLSPVAAWLPVQAGHAPSLHMIAVWDLVVEGGPYEEEVQVVQRALDAGYYGAVVEGSRPFTFDLDTGYVVDPSFAEEGDGLAPRTGWAVRPVRIRVRR